MHLLFASLIGCRRSQVNAQAFAEPLQLGETGGQLPSGFPPTSQVKLLGPLTVVALKDADVVAGLVIGAHDVEHVVGDVMLSCLTAGRIEPDANGTWVTCVTLVGFPAAR